MNKKVFNIISISLLLVCCASLKVDNESYYYEIINLSLEKKVSIKNDTIYLRKKTFNKRFKQILENEIILSVIKDSELLNTLEKQNEREYLLQQLDESFSVNFDKVNSTGVMEYIDPLERKDSLGNVIIDNYYVKVFSGRKLSFSKPVFTKSKEYCLMIVSTDDAGVQIELFKKNKKNKWFFYKYLNMP